MAKKCDENFANFVVFLGEKYGYFSFQKKERIRNKIFCFNF